MNSEYMAVLLRRGSKRIKSQHIKAFESFGEAVLAQEVKKSLEKNK